jgi:acetyl esterase
MERISAHGDCGGRADPRLHPDMLPLLDSALRYEELGVDRARREFMSRRVIGDSQPDKPPEDVAVGPGSKLRLRVARPSGTPCGVLLFIHGGGWVLGSADASDEFCWRLAELTGMEVASVDYRLAPEAPYPDALDDCELALNWALTEHSRLAEGAVLGVIGESAGGNLAAALSLRRRRLGRAAADLQVLIYPCLDPALSSPSAVEFADGYGLTRSNMVWFWANYAARSHRQEPEVAPALAADLSGLPPTLVLTAELDLLRDEGEIYADRLREAGCRAASHRYEGMLHGFFRLPDVDLARQAVGDVARFARAEYLARDRDQDGHAALAGADRCKLERLQRGEAMVRH